MRMIRQVRFCGRTSIMNLHVQNYVGKVTTACGGSCVSSLMMNITHASGYRIQVINTQNRDEANNVKAEMLRRFPEQKAYLLYKAPNFKVRVGNFLTRKDAEPTRKMIADLYPSRGIYLIADRVEYKPKEDEDPTGMD